MNVHVQAPAWPPNYVEVFAWRQKMLRMYRSDPRTLAAALAYYAQPGNWTDFIEDWIDTYDPRNAGKPGMLTRMPFVMFDRQRDLIEFLIQLMDADADGLIEKCRDAGVTWLGVALSVTMWRFVPGVAIGWGSRKAMLVDTIGDMNSIFEKIRSVIRGLPVEFLPRGFDERVHMPTMRIINPETDAAIVGEGGDNIGRGGRTRLYFKDESAHYERPELIEASLSENTRVQVDISSVNGIGNVFHRKRKGGKVWEGDGVVKDRVNIFIFDWRDHPAKTPEWYMEKRRKAEEAGLLHIVAQEIDRDYAASIEGVILQPHWLEACIDAHKKLNIPQDGMKVAMLDVADEGGDKNALSKRTGLVLNYAKAWAEGDTGQTARRAVAECGPNTLLMYDSVGVGAGIKSETNRLKSQNDLPVGMRVVPWNAGGEVIDPDKPMNEKDKDSPLNEDFFANLKAQAWWRFRMRCFATYEMVVNGIQYPLDSLISFDRDAIGKRDLLLLIEELCQPVWTHSTGRLKLMVDKKPNGAQSPNRADSVVANYLPPKIARYQLLDAIG